MCYDNKEWCKSWKGNDLSLQNGHKAFNRFWPEHSKIQKVFILIGCFWPKYIMLGPRKYRRVIFDDNQDW